MPTELHDEPQSRTNCRPARSFKLNNHSNPSSALDSLHKDRRPTNNSSQDQNPFEKSLRFSTNTVSISISKTNTIQYNPASKTRHIHQLCSPACSIQHLEPTSSHHRIVITPFQPQSSPPLRPLSSLKPLVFALNPRLVPTILSIQRLVPPRPTQS